MRNAEEWIRDLELRPLPEEGGWYNEVYRSDEFLAQRDLPARFGGKRTFCTSIYYLLKGSDFAAFHRIRQDETWHFYEGSGLVVHVIDPHGTYTQVKLGRAFDDGERFQATVKRGCLFAAAVSRPDSFSLVGCTVAPGFEFQDFEAPARARLLEEYPRHRDVILRLTR